MLREGGLVAAVTLALTGCTGGLVPPPADRAPPPSAASPRLTADLAEPPARRPVAATPIAPVPASPADATGTASAASLIAGPAIASLPIDEAMAARALAAFRTSCPGPLKRPDPRGLTRQADWQPACAAAAAGGGDPRGFFAERFEAVQVADGKAHATGYYEPEIEGARTRGGRYQTPVYRRPPDLVDIDLGAFSAALAGKRLRGRIEGATLVPYAGRAAIDRGALSGRGLEIAWAADPVELFFLQVQGSGRLRLPDGSVMRIGYDNQNGHDYVGIGKLMRDRGLLQPGQASMQGIMGWLRANPDQGRAIMEENGSYIFFRELTGAGPLGAMGYPVVARASVAADPKFVPLGAPVFLSMDRQDATGLWVAQDTGGAIKGSNRIDTFWGAGSEARAIAGGMSARGTAWLLLPRGTLARLGRGGGAAAQR